MNKECYISKLNPDAPIDGLNREILFRGKGLPKYSGEDWYCGYLLFDGKDYQIVDPEYCSWRKTVLKETVGEFTGMTDKNGTKIFEGDIVRTQPFYDRPYSATRKGKQFFGVVNLHFRTFKGNKIFPEQKYDSFWQVDIIEDDKKYNHYSWSRFWNCEVVGNKFDNPELLSK